MLTYLVDLLLKLAGMLVQPSDLTVQVGFYLLTFVRYLLHTLVSALKFVIDSLGALC